MRKRIWQSAPVLVAAAVIGMCLTGPVEAGVQGTGGGTKSVTTTRDSVFTDRVTSRSTSYLAPIIRDQGTRITSRTSSNHYTTYNNTSRANGRSVGLRSPGTVSRTSFLGSNTFTSFLRTTDELRANNHIRYDYNSTGTTYDRTESSKTVNASTDLIIIGDTDNIENAYVAQGSLDVDIDITDYYWNNLHETDVRQKVFDRYQDYNQHTNNYYRTDNTYYPYVSPLVLNLDGTGRLMASNGNWKPHDTVFTDRLALFDFYGNGEEVLMEWVGPKDGLLCVPKTDGSVDGTCLFGIANGYSNGYEELSAMRDLNADGKVSGAELDGLFVWQDANGNGIAGASELTSVQDLGITEISTRHSDFVSSFTMNGKTQKMWDWWPNVTRLKKMAPPQGA
jgi:hypothetical protein